MERSSNMIAHISVLSLTSDHQTPQSLVIPGRKWFVQRGIEQRKEARGVPRQLAESAIDKETVQDLGWIDPGVAAQSTQPDHALDRVVQKRQVRLGIHFACEVNKRTIFP